MPQSALGRNVNVDLNCHSGRGHILTRSFWRRHTKMKIKDGTNSQQGKATRQRGGSSRQTRTEGGRGRRRRLCVVRPPSRRRRRRRRRKRKRRRTDGRTSGKTERQCSRGEGASRNRRALVRPPRASARALARARPPSCAPPRFPSPSPPSCTSTTALARSLVPLSLSLSLPIRPPARTRRAPCRCAPSPPAPRRLSAAHVMRQSGQEEGERGRLCELTAAAAPILSVRILASWHRSLSTSRLSGHSFRCFS